MKTIIQTLVVLALATASPAFADKKEGKTSEAAVPAALSGKLVKLTGDDIKDHEIATDKEYYVLYHSASW